MGEAPKRRWFQFRLGTLLWVFLTASLVFLLLAITDENRELRRQMEVLNKERDHSRAMDKALFDLLHRDPGRFPTGVLPELEK